MTDDQIRQQARDAYESTTVEIEPEGTVERAEGGAWVQAWVWVEDE